jgi:hypothetical protein
MTKAQSARLDVFRQTIQFGKDNQSKFPKDSPAGQAFETLSTVLSTFPGDAAAATTGARQGLVQKRDASQELVFHLNAIARIARVTGETTPGFADRFLLPVPESKARLLSTSESFAKASEPVAAQLIAAGLPADFLTTLRSATEAYAQASAAHAAGRVMVAKANASLTRSIRTGMTAVRTIDAIVRYQFADDVDMQATWRRVKRLSGLPAPKSESASTPNATTTPATPATVTAEGHSHEKAEGKEEMNPKAA